MRLNLKVFVLFIILAVMFMTISLWTKCNDVTKQDNNFYREETPFQKYENAPEHRIANGHHLQGARNDQTAVISYEPIECLVNNEYTITARREGNEVYIPFSFLQKYYEVYGRIIQGNGFERFEWQHSYSRIYKPRGKYTTDGIFMSFDHYNVEVRDRVKCISGREGVPLSTQWGPQGYFYPIQIAQFGLSHYSKFLVEKEPLTEIYEDGADDGAKWMTQEGKSSVTAVEAKDLHQKVIKFVSKDSLSSAGVTLNLDATETTSLSLDYKLVSNGSISVKVETKNKHMYHIHYVCSPTVLSREKNHIYYGIGAVGLHKHWSHLSRELNTDLQKGIALNSKARKSWKAQLGIYRVVSLTLRGSGYVDNVTLSSAAHLDHFYAAADWLVNHQDQRGGWPVHVTRKLANGALELPPGWYSAMAQGQAMSTLTRAYIRTGNRKYLSASLRATKIFDVKSQDNGVLAKFMDKHNWFEEYPTIPSCYVLNGFIYSLIGLYDLKSVAPSDYVHDAERLFNSGMDTLKVMLPLFDTGSGSIYDLRHITLGVAPNLARWDYHTTHVNQILLLSTVDDDPILKNTAERWIDYMKGKRAPHN
ncbi:D-glucuronyl C5-epimerase-like isoform X2 [Lineus longissimus]